MGATLHKYATVYRQHLESLCKELTSRVALLGRFASSGWSSMECWVLGQPSKTPYFHPRHRHPSSWTYPSKNSVGTPPYRWQTFPNLFTQIGYDLLCVLWVWRRRTNRRTCWPTMSNLSTFPWTARPDSFGRWENGMSAQHLPRDLVRPSSGQ